MYNNNERSDIMKKIFLLLICILLGLSFFSVDGDAYYDVKSEPINYDDFFEKKEINYSFFSSKEISNDEKLNIKHNDIEYDFLVGNNTFYEVSNYSFSCNYYLTVMDEKVSDNSIVYAGYHHNFRSTSIHGRLEYRSWQGVDLQGQRDKSTV